jgi:hypothetical protein
LPDSLTPTHPVAIRHLFEIDEAAHVVDEVRHSDLAPRANDADNAHDLGAGAL